MPFTQESLTIPLIHDDESGLLVMMIGDKLLPLCNTKVGSLFLLARQHAELPVADQAMTFRSSEGWRISVPEGGQLAARDGAAWALLYNLQLDQRAAPFGPLLDIGQFYEEAGVVHARELDGKKIQDVTQQALDVFYAYRRGELSPVEAAHEGERLAVLLSLLPDNVQQATLDVKVGVEESVSPIILDSRG